jgi:YVTN family beta-propeller protein
MRTRTASLATLLLALAACHPSTPYRDRPGTMSTRLRPRLPTGQTLDPAGVVRDVGPMPLAMVPAPGGRRLVLLLNGYRQQGIQVVDRAGAVTQTLPQRAAFIGLAFSPDGSRLYASGGNRDLVYAYHWAADSAVLADSLVLRATSPDSNGTRYPAGLALAADGRTMYVAENLGDSLAVVDVASGRVTQRLATGSYPYAVAVTPDGTVFVSNWGANTLSVFTPVPHGRTGGATRLVAAPPIAAGRHPSALLLSADGSRLFAASGSTDRVTVVDTRTRSVVAQLLDPPPAGPGEGSTPNALALSADGTRLFVAEADANALAVFDLSASAAGTEAAQGYDRLAGRIPTGWFPTAVATLGDTLYVVNGKGAGTGPNPDGPVPGGRRHPPTAYTLGQLSGSISIVPAARLSGAELEAFTARVTRANGWTGEATNRGTRYPPFAHVLYIIRENRTYDQVLGDVSLADGDTSLVLFGRAVTPNAHAIAERFGIFDRFFVNAEVSADGHNWSTAAYASDYTQKTTPTNYAGDGRSYDYEGTNRGRVPEDDVAEPASGYLWDLAEHAGITYRNFGEFVVEDGPREARRYRGTKPFLAAHTDSLFPWFDMNIPDQRRADIWLTRFRQWVADGRMPALQVMHLPRDHTSGGAAGQHTPQAMVADNDLALGRIVEALSHSPFWESTVVFVLEDDAQNGPDHVDSHRSPLLVISAWNRPGVYHRFGNTTDVLRTIEEILGLASLSQFDYYGRPFREIWADRPDLAPYTALVPTQPLDQTNPARTRAALESRHFDLSRADAIDDEAFSRVIWLAVKGEGVPYPGARRMSALEAVRGR